MGHGVGDLVDGLAAGDAAFVLQVHVASGGHHLDLVVGGPAGLDGAVDVGPYGAAEGGEPGGGEVLGDEAGGFELAG